MLPNVQTTRNKNGKFKSFLLLDPVSSLDHSSLHSTTVSVLSGSATTTTNGKVSAALSHLIKEIANSCVLLLVFFDSQQFDCPFPFFEFHYYAMFFEGGQWPNNSRRRRARRRRRRPKRHPEHNYKILIISLLCSMVRQF